MNIVLYQIIGDTDEKRRARFMSINAIKQMYPYHFPSHLYTEAWSGEVHGAKTLEDIYHALNRVNGDIEDFHCRSMSVSDVIGVKNQNGSIRYDYCDVLGFKEIDFKPEEIPV